MKPSFIVVFGGVLSGVGKGTIASSIGLLLKGYGFNVSAIKIDPYLNVDAGTMSPHEHGEVYVLDDGGECDLDLGNYERFIEIDLERHNNITTGKIYKEVIERERRGDYLGQTVQIIPHVTDHIMEKIRNAAQVKVGTPARDPDVVIIELGGTIGDMESEPFLYALSQLRRAHSVCYIHVGLVVHNNNEFKTKPFQRSVRDIRSRGINPDFVIVRCDTSDPAIHEQLKQKIAGNCAIAEDQIIISGKVATIYHVPKILHEQYLPARICRKLDIAMMISLKSDFTQYNRLLEHIEAAKQTIRVAIIGKYTGTDTYLSIERALEHAGFALGVHIYHQVIDSETLNDPTVLADFDRILVPGGFGDRGIEGKKLAIRYARKERKPFLGICLGLQLFVIEYFQTELGLPRANSTEFDVDADPAIIQHLSVYGDEICQQLGGTMRLGGQDMKIVYDDGVAAEAYSPARESRERHRHRYELAPVFTEYLAAHPTELVVSAVSNDPLGKQIPDIVEWRNKGEWRAIGCQFHPEYVSRNSKPHPLFWAFIHEN